MPRCLRVACAKGVLYRAACATVALSGLFAHAATLAHGAEPHEAATDAATRRQAAAAIPLDKVEPAYRDAVRDVVSQPTLFRRLPTSVVDCRPAMFTYVVENPEALVEIWSDLGLSHAELVRTGENTFALSDGAGTTGEMVVVESTCEAGAQNRIVMYVDGRYEGKPFNRPLTAKCVLLLRSGSIEETNGRQYVAARIDSFIKLDQTSVALLAKAMHPLIGKTADRNFADTVGFISSLSYTAEARPERIRELAVSLDGLDEPRKQRFDNVIDECHRSGIAWQQSRLATGLTDPTPR
ncbi:MAG: hypothetical protein KDA44_20480 [Planctomycetales bacterium]|nr:hypothetical protein [Planctomycetales bacterium]